MLFREATIEDIPQIQIVRNSVKENTLSDPSVVTDTDCELFLTVKGKGWVCLINNEVIGFSIVDLTDQNVWALFLQPEFEGIGIGRKLMDILLEWYFSVTNDTIWLGTAPGTRAEQFYLKYGWKIIGMHGKGEVKFELTYNDWSSIRIGG